MIHIRLNILVFCITAITLAAPRLRAAECTPLSETTARRLEVYVHDKFGFAPTATMSLLSSELVGLTCFRKVSFARLTGERQKASFSLYLSPDQKFLTRDLLDTTEVVAQGQRRDSGQILSELTNGNFPVTGNSKGAVTLTVFSDFQCPFCKKEESIIVGSVLPMNKNVRLVYRNMPLPSHSWARPAAEMAACVFQQSNEAFWAVHDAMFEKQAELGTGGPAELIKSVIDRYPSVNLEDYLRCVANHRTAEQIDRDLELAKQYRIEGTPTIFVNTVRFDGLTNAEDLEAVIHASFANDAPTRRHVDEANREADQRAK